MALLVGCVQHSSTREDCCSLTRARGCARARRLAYAVHTPAAWLFPGVCRSVYTRARGRRGYPSHGPSGGGIYSLSSLSGAYRARNSGTGAPWLWRYRRKAAVPTPPTTTSTSTTTSAARSPPALDFFEPWPSQSPPPPSSSSSPPSWSHQSSSHSYSPSSKSSASSIRPPAPSTTDTSVAATCSATISSTKAGISLSSPHQPHLSCASASAGQCPTKPSSEELA
mmetsp:Transcript_10955/g.38005  ORF Transcript_10955/g.38005 Transcript_10955/m.38005 type:complete len:225 (+) Transcript_10955:45-719(+)